MLYEVITVAALVAIFSMVPGFAQETEWRIAPYAWIAGLDGTVGVGDRTGGDRLDGNFGQLSRITSYNVCYTKLLRVLSLVKERRAAA